jgi:hypothetical protein
VALVGLSVPATGLTRPLAVALDLAMATGGTRPRGRHSPAGRLTSFSAGPLSAWGRPRSAFAAVKSVKHDGAGMSSTRKRNEQGSQ